MEDIDEDRKHEVCSQLIDDGQYDEALRLAESIVIPSFRAAILIDAGAASEKPGKVREGTEIFERLLAEKPDLTDRTRCTYMYNSANGHSTIYKLKRIRRKQMVPPNDDDLRSAKRLYQETLATLDDQNDEFLSQVLVNLGNCLSQMGRYVDAAEYYRRAMIADPTNGMASGNLAIELEYIAWALGRFRHEYIALAYELLRQTFGTEMHLQYRSMPAFQAFRSTLARIHEFISAHKEPILPPSPIVLQREGSTYADYVHYCLDNGLFLNPWIGHDKLAPGITDDIAFGPITSGIDANGKVPELLSILNEIKESFATARYLLYISERQDDTLDLVSSLTIYHHLELHEYKGIYIGLYKTAYSRAFDVLDKMARKQQTNRQRAHNRL